jgi:hypothetical protein
MRERAVTEELALFMVDSKWERDRPILWANTLAELRLQILKAFAMSLLDGKEVYFNPRAHRPGSTDGIYISVTHQNGLLRLPELDEIMALDDGPGDED